MLGPLAVLCALLFPAGLKLEQTPVVVGRLGTSATLLCTVDSSVYYIHWYFHKKFAAPKRLLYLDMSSSSVQRDTSVKAHKVNAKKGKDSYSCNLLVQKLEKSDEGVYYCACGWSGWYNKVLGPGTILRVTDKSANEDTSPKPTVFLPSISEIKIHKAGTYLCLLEDFFPEIIKVDWKEKNDQTVLQSQQGNTMKTKDTYMKFSWLTVTGASMDKEHKCIVNHESDRGGINQEILFPSINEGISSFQISVHSAWSREESKISRCLILSKSRTLLLILSLTVRAIAFLLVSSCVTALSFLPAWDMWLVGSFLGSHCE
uniref:Ig-like domain-containing protein n=1 Tax=Canis lupus dingo TaxID=286419 RepID=A0A8C0LH61_CANLU